MIKKGKINTTTEENITLQKIFIDKGFSFFNGRKEPHIRENLDFFYFNVENKEIAIDTISTSHNNRNIFNLKFYNGLEYFKKHKNKELTFKDCLILINKL